MTLRLSNAPNARDLGGHLTGDGRRVRRHVLFRADALHRLSEADLEVVARLKLACVIDFRSPAEVARSGADRLPVPGPRLVELPIVDLDLFGVITDALSRGGDGTELDFLREDAPGGGAPAMMAKLYRRFVSDETMRAAFAQALRLVATAENLPLLFHCTVGKDRTGWLAAVVLTVLDVPRDVIVADYVHTNECSREFVDLVVSLLDGRVSDPQVVVPTLEARPAYLEAAFAEADRVFGGMDGYVREGLGADDELLESLRANLLEP
ncbi:MAG: tyrosine-protein phosphatase [Micromonosporaceae bacterium]|nr:tyrosine-protein phosphatase [Micromonosporaceae bacterium]